MSEITGTGASGAGARDCNPTGERVEQQAFASRRARPMHEVLMIGFIDPPLPYAPKTQWRQFLARMRRLLQHDPQVQAAIEEAHEALAPPDPPQNLPPAA